MNNLEITATMLIEVFLWRTKVIYGSYLGRIWVNNFGQIYKKTNPSKYRKYSFEIFKKSRELTSEFFLWQNLLAENSAHSNYKKNVEYGASNNGTDTNIGFSEENS